MKRILIAIGIILGVWITGYMIGRNHTREGETVIQIDTLIRHDTIRIKDPVLIERTRKDCLLVAVHDTIRIRDSVFVALPMESKTYKGEEYLAVVSGYNPSLDRIEVYPKTMVISKTETTTLQPSPFRYSVYVGADYGWMWQKYFTPNVGAEVGYKKVSLGIECGVGLEVLDNTFHSPKPYFQVGMRYALVNR